MSSFLIYYSKTDQAGVINKLPGHSYAKVNDFIVFYKNNHQTLIVSFESLPKFIISGVGIHNSQQGGFISKDEWKNILLEKNFQCKINGHFAGCIIDDNKISCFNDVLGLREVYYLITNDGFIISSRIDLFKNLINDLEPSINYIAGHWLTSMPLFYETAIKSVKRLIPGSLLKIDTGLKTELNRITPNYVKSSEHKIINTLKHFTQLNYHEKITSLGLSGGLDSRTLLAILSNSSYQHNFSTHTFGSEELSDVKISGSIAHSQKLAHSVYNNHAVNLETTLQLVKNYIPFTALTIPISDLIHINYHKMISESNKVIIDGGFGEIGRRQFLNKFLLGGKKIITERNTTALLRNISVNKGNIFNSEYRLILSRSLENSSEEVWEKMNDVTTDNIFLWLDLLSIRYRLPNIYSHGQHCLDQISIAYMPFAQKEFLEQLLLLPARDKINGKLYRQIIKNDSPPLQNFPLVKDYIEYPYSFGTISSHVYRKLKRKLNNEITTDPIKYELYNGLKEYIGDEINSKSFTENDFYEKVNIQSIFREYYSGNKTKFAELDWWLTFYEWYKNMNTNSLD